MIDIILFYSAIYCVVSNATRRKFYFMKHKKIVYILLAVMLIIVLSYNVYNNYNQYERRRPLSHNELIGYINKYCLRNEYPNLKIEVEKDVDNSHIVLLSHNDMNSNQAICFAVFDKLANNKYRYEDCTFNIHPLTYSEVIEASNIQSKNPKFYYIFCGIIKGNDPNKFSLKIGNKEFKDIIEKDKFFIKVYDMGNAQGMSIAPICDNQ